MYYITHVILVEKPTRVGYYVRLSYYTKKDLAENNYFLKGNHKKIYDQDFINSEINKVKIVSLTKPIELGSKMDLYLGIDGKVYKGPKSHPETEMESIGLIPC